MCMGPTSSTDLGRADFLTTSKKNYACHCILKNKNKIHDLIS